MPCRHVDKKPSGGKAELEEYFGCLASELIMVRVRCDVGQAGSDSFFDSQIRAKFS